MDQPAKQLGTCADPKSADLLHYIRAMVRRLRAAATEPHRVHDQSIERHLATLLRHAIDSSSALDIVVTLGCAAELSLYPEETILEQCTSAVRAAGKSTLVGALWAVRHRCARAGEDRRRFVI
ncbi:MULTISPECIES: hypothetical protein [Cupriavidus]|uniref:hypothetical protein n=1 Tax=Cupriavidus sp. DF5525 TaxID=3160989 RepID=UPI0032DEC1AC